MVTCVLLLSHRIQKGSFVCISDFAVCDTEDCSGSLAEVWVHCPTGLYTAHKWTSCATTEGGPPVLRERAAPGYHRLQEMSDFVRAALAVSRPPPPLV